MPHTINQRMIKASLEYYLDALSESGIDGVPFDAEIRSMPEQHTSAVPPVTATACQPQEPHRSAGDSHSETLEKIRKDLGECQRCPLAKTRKNLVFGVGNPRARLLFVGEGPGADEDAQGEPFVGAAGQMLNRIINGMGLKREDVYICNVVKCRPPNNRDPLVEEIEACSPFLLRQIRSVNPEVIVALGKPASHTLLGNKEPISRLRGRFRDYHGIPLMPTYHPSYLLRSQGDSKPFWDVWDDMVQVLRLLKLPVPEKSRKK